MSRGRGFPEFIRDLRKRLNMSQQTFADYIGASQSQVHLWEIGEVTPRHATVERIGKEFNQVSGSTASSFKGTFRSGPESRVPRKKSASWEHELLARWKRK